MSERERESERERKTEREREREREERKECFELPDNRKTVEGTSTFNMSVDGG